MSDSQVVQGIAMPPSQGAVIQPSVPMPGPGMQPGVMPGMQPAMGGMPVQGIGPTGGPQGTCVMRISEDRTAVSLTDQTGQQVHHVALGQDRIQKIFNSPDSSWSVVVYKVRRVSQFGGIAINLTQCEPQEARDFQGIPEAIEFLGEEMAIRYPGGTEELFPLVNKRLP